MEFKNPWGKGSTQFDKWFQNPWSGNPILRKAAEKIGQQGMENPSDISSETKTVLICCGNGAELGNFEYFAEFLKKKHLIQRYQEQNIIIVKTLTRIELFGALEKFGGPYLSELHIFSHSAGAGLFLGYHDAQLMRSRSSFMITPDLDYDKVVAFETGPLFTDHLIVTYKSQRKSIRMAVRNIEFAKFWGCNSGVSDWVYEHDDPRYWDYLNDKNVPKPSIAQAFADYTNKAVYGALSGSHIEYMVNGNWGIYSTQPTTFTDMRLHPDEGDYMAFNPF